MSALAGLTMIATRTCAPDIVLAPTRPADVNIDELVVETSAQSSPARILRGA